LGSAHNTFLVGDVLEKMIDAAQVKKIKQTDLEADDYEQCVDELKTLRDSYTRY
jgi:hypothetical protein